MATEQIKYMTTIFLLVLAVVILVVSGQVLWKMGVGGQIHDLASFLTAIKSLLVLLGAFLYLIATAIWIVMLSRYSYHFVYPLLSLSFVLALIASRFIFHEEVSWLAWLGVGVICFGITLIGFSGR